jgi:hypothetical protein
LKVTAHPLMVAVAMGLLGPAVLAADEHCEETCEEKQTSVEKEVLSALEADEGPIWSQLSLHDA